MEDITVQELKERLDQGEQLNIIDVREQHEYDEANMGTQLIPLGDLPFSTDQLDTLKDQELIIHCRSGARSAMGKQILEEKGFTKVRNLLGGILAWQELQAGE